ncbi:hypothetical protein ACIBJF_26460 [Streptomyces sp. NPDC050743]
MEWQQVRDSPAAVSQATVGWFDRAAEDCRRIPVGEQCEVL